MDKPNRIKTGLQKRILNGKTCRKERFRNGSALDVFSRVWALRNSIAVRILVAIPLCDVWGPAL